MEIHVGDLIIGEITQVRPYALFLTFEDGKQGLLHISEISNLYIRDIEKYGTVGDKLRVKVLEIDPNNGFLRVSLKQVSEDMAYSTHEESRKNKVVTDENEFKTLKDNLPKWIEETLKEAKKENDDND